MSDVKVKDSEVKKVEEVSEPTPKAPAPLRRPREMQNNNDAISDKITFSAPDNKAEVFNHMMRKNNNKQNNNNTRNNRNFNNNVPKKDMRRPAEKEEKEDDWDFKPNTNAQQNLNRAIQKPKVPEPVAKNPELVTKISEPIAKNPEPVTKISELIAKKSEPVAKKPESIPVVKETVAAPKPKVVTQELELVPKHYIVEKLPMGDSFLISVENETPEGFICLAIHTDYEEAFNKLCNEYTVACEKDNVPFSPLPGESCSFPSPADGGWYRARALSSTRVQLVDGCRTERAPAAVCRRLPGGYDDIPEFSVLLDAKVSVGVSLKCTLLSKTTDGFKVSLVDAETDTDMGQGEIRRWLPPIERVEKKSVTAPAAPTIPSVPRAPLAASSRVVLLDVTSLRRACVRATDEQTSTSFDQVLQDVVLYAMKASPLAQPPRAGQTVIAKFTDGQHYRALVKRTNVKENKYLIEYIEYGNEEKTTLEKLYPCPPNLDLTESPTQASIVQLHDQDMKLTTEAELYIEKMKEAVELVLTIPTGEDSVPSGSLVNLTIQKNNECINKKLVELCTPEWKKLELQGVDVLSTKRYMYADLTYVELPTDREFVLEVCNWDMLQDGSICGWCKDEPMVGVVNGKLQQMINEYCESDFGKEPYLPALEELCIAKHPASGSWCRAVLVELAAGAGSGSARVYLVDRGQLAALSVKDLRKVQPDFLQRYPALALHLEIKGFPSNPSPSQLSAAIDSMTPSAGGRRQLAVKAARPLDSGLYEVHAPALNAALAL